MKNTHLYFTILIFIILCNSCKEQKLAQQKAAQPKIAIAGFSIESSTFSPATTAEEAFHARYQDGIYYQYPFLGAESELRNSANWIPTLRGHALPGGIVTAEAYESLMSKTLTLLEKNLPYDGIFLDIHGAMSVEGLDDPEGDMITRIRKLVGYETLISTSMDLHGNVSQRLARETDMITCYRMAPHEDAMESKKRAASNLVKRLEQGLGKPKYKAWVKVPILLPGEKTSTRVEPGKSLYAKVDPLTKQDGVIDAAIWMGYPWADEPRNHGVVMAYGDDKNAVAKAVKELAQAFWDVRDEFEFVAPTTTLEKAVQEAIKSDKRPFFISDMGDNPTAGGAGDVTWTLDKILKHSDLNGKKEMDIIYASIPGPDLVEKAMKAGIGKEVTGMVGAAIDNRYAPPIELTGTVTAIKEGDKNAKVEVVIRSGNVSVIVTQQRKPYHYEQDFLDLDLSIREADLVFVKIGYLVPELYDIQKGWLMALTPGGVDQDLKRLEYKRIQRPMFPVDTFKKEPELEVEFMSLSEE